MRAWVMEQNESNLDTARAYLEQRGDFPQRAALNQLVGMFLTELYETAAEWVVWASGVVEGWPEDPADAPFDPTAAKEGVRRAERVMSLLSRPVSDDRERGGARPATS
jgi:hypothetical protein